DGRIALRGQLSVDDQVPTSGTLILTPVSQRQSPVTAIVDRGAFAFTRETGPYPGQYSARFNRDEAAIEEIIETAELDPRLAARQFHVQSVPRSRLTKASDMATTVEVTPQSTFLSIQLTTASSQR